MNEVANCEPTDEKGVTKKELKMRLERCFIDMRREFGLMCLEKFSIEE